MKPNQTNRTRDYYRYHRRRVIKRKQCIVKFRYSDEYHKQIGRLSKEKIHCSCFICTGKSNVIGIRHSERVKQLKLAQSMQDYKM